MHVHSNKAHSQQHHCHLHYHINNIKSRSIIYGKSYELLCLMYISNMYIHVLISFTMSIILFLYSPLTYMQEREREREREPNKMETSDNVQSANIYTFRMETNYSG